MPQLVAARAGQLLRWQNLVGTLINILLIHLNFSENRIRRWPTVCKIGKRQMALYGYSHNQQSNISKRVVQCNINRPITCFSMTKIYRQTIRRIDY